MSIPVAAGQQRADGGYRPDPATPRHPGAALTAAVLGNFVVILDAVVVNVALPSIRHSLGGGVSGLQWVVDGYTLMFAALLLSAGALSDRVGARRAFGRGMVLFVLASAACGLAPGIGALVTARLVQGSAAAVMMPSSMALIRQVFPGATTRARALAIWAMGGAVASSAGPVLGGVLDVVDWRLIFFINLPVGAVTLVLLARTQRSRRRSVPFDWVGQVTAVLAMGGLTYGAIEAGAVGVSAPQVLAALVVAAVAMVVFVAAQARGSHPMVPLEVFRSRNVVLLLVVGFTYMVGYYGMPFVFSLYFQQVRGLSALGAGALFVPMMLAGTVLTPFWPRIADRLGRKTLIAGGLSLMTIGLVVLGVLPGSTPVWLLSTLMILVGVGGPLVMPPATAVLLDSVPERRTGTVSGVFNTSRQVGGALAVAVFGGLLAGPGMFLRGVHTSLLIAAVVLAAAIPAGLLLRTHPTVSTETA